MTSLELRTEIGSLASSGASIQVLRVTMTFVTECGVEINSFSEQRCSTPAASQELPLVPIIVGGALGGVILLMLCGILAVCVVICRKKRTKKENITRRR